MPNSKVNATVASIKEIDLVSNHIIRRKEATTDTATKKKFTDKIKLKEKLGQYLVETSMGAESRCTARSTFGNMKEMRQRYPRTTFKWEE